MLRLKFIAFLCLVSVFSYAQKPNILWVTIEDTSPNFIGCYGNESASTPNIDKLASEGVRFTNAFSTGTVCSPSRCTIITGMRTFEMGTGNHRSQYPIPDFIKGFPYYMQQAGYYVTNNSKTDYNVRDPKSFIREAWNENSNTAGWWNRKPGQPFFAIFNYNDSHQSRTMTNDYATYKKEILDLLPESDRIGENEFPMPPFYRDSPEMRKQFARVYNSIKYTDNKVGKLLAQLEADNLRDSTIIFFYGDHGEGIPRGKTNGINLGYRVPFVVWFPPMYRHLSPWGNGVVSDELIDFEDLAPTLISLAQGQVPSHMKGRVLIGKDRTAPVNKLFLSSDRSDNGIDMVRTVTDGRYVYSRNYLSFMPEARYIRYMEIGEIKQIMRKDFAEKKLNPLQRSLFEPRPAEFLYDIKNDPWETKNLADDRSMKPVLEEMRAALKKNVLASRDVMFLPEYEIALISETTTPFEFRLDKQKYPLEEIYAAASLSGMRGKDIAKQQVALLTNANKIVRYWAAVGLRAQNAKTLKPFRSALEKAMQDSYAPVAITASAISYDIFKNKAAEEALKKYCKEKNVQLALMAINYLLYVEEPEPFQTTLQEINKMKGLDYEIAAATKDVLGRMGLIPNTFDYK